MKRKTTLMLSLMLIFGIDGIYANAAGNQPFINNVYQDEMGDLNILCTLPEMKSRSEGYKVMLGDEELSIRSVSEVDQADIAQTVYCLVDISGSMKGRMDESKNILKTIGVSLNGSDNMVIAQMGNEITESAFLSHPEEINAEVDALEYTGQDTNLYSGVIQGLQFLQQTAGVNPAKSLVILSDGVDDQKAGVTWNEAYAAVEKADVPIYTATIILSDSDYEKAKEMGSFARASAGGIHFPKSVEGSSTPAAMTGSEIGTEIAESINSAVCIKANLADIQEKAQDKYTVSVVFEDGSGTNCDDSIEVDARELKFPETVIETETEVPTEQPIEWITEQITEKPIETETEPERAVIPIWKDKKTIVAAVGAGSLVILILLLVLRKRKIKKQRQEEQRREEEMMRQEEERIRREAEEALKKKEQEEAKRQQETVVVQPKRGIRFTKIGRNEEKVVLELTRGKELHIGRNDPGAILDMKDERLSRDHFAMLWDGKKVYIWDRDSKNGTAVNGIPIKPLGKIEIKSQDTISVGSYDYRVFWKE